MKKIINPETQYLKENGLELNQGVFNEMVKRTMFDGKISGILSGAGSASCQLCTANREQLKNCEIIEYGFEINTHIKDVINIFSGKY